MGCVNKVQHSFEYSESEEDNIEYDNLKCVFQYHQSVMLKDKTGYWMISDNGYQLARHNKYTQLTSYIATDDVDGIAYLMNNGSMIFITFSHQIFKVMSMKNTHEVLTIEYTKNDYVLN